MAISADGFVATTKDDTSWVSSTDWENFRVLVKQSRCVVMGRRTYEESGEDFPYDCELNVVMTKDKTLHSSSTNVLFTSETPKKAVSLIEKKGFNKLLIIGGGKIYASFLKDGLLDEIILSVHPKILGNGIKVFEDHEFNVDLKLSNVKQLKEGLVQLHYKMSK